jgi:hypothetical protein
VAGLDSRDDARPGACLPILAAEGLGLEREEAKVKQEAAVAVLGQTSLIGPTGDRPVEEGVDRLE